MNSPTPSLSFLSRHLAHSHFLLVDIWTLEFDHFNKAEPTESRLVSDVFRLRVQRTDHRTEYSGFTGWNSSLFHAEAAEGIPAAKSLSRLVFHHLTSDEASSAKLEDLNWMCSLSDRSSAVTTSCMLIQYGDHYLSVSVCPQQGNWQVQWILPACGTLSNHN